LAEGTRIAFSMRDRFLLERTRKKKSPANDRAPEFTDVAAGYQLCESYQASTSFLT